MTCEGSALGGGGGDRGDDDDEDDEVDERFSVNVELVLDAAAEKAARARSMRRLCHIVVR